MISFGMWKPPKGSADIWGRIVDVARTLLIPPPVEYFWLQQGVARGLSRSIKKHFITEVPPVSKLAFLATMLTAN